jgi:hypothetical protein
VIYFSLAGLVSTSCGDCIWTKSYSTIGCTWFCSHAHDSCISTTRRHAS